MGLQSPSFAEVPFLSPPSFHRGESTLSPVCGGLSTIPLKLHGTRFWPFSPQSSLFPLQRDLETARPPLKLLVAGFSDSFALPIPYPLCAAFPPCPPFPLLQVPLSWLFYEFNRSPLEPFTRTHPQPLPPSSLKPASCPSKFQAHTGRSHLLFHFPSSFLSSPVPLPLFLYFSPLLQQMALRRLASVCIIFEPPHPCFNVGFV